MFGTVYIVTCVYALQYVLLYYALVYVCVCSVYDQSMLRTVYV